MDIISRSTERNSEQNWSAAINLSQRSGSLVKKSQYFCVTQYFHAPKSAYLRVGIFVSASSDDFKILYDEVNTLLCRDIDVRTVVTDKLVQSSNSDKFGAKFRTS